MSSHIEEKPKGLKIEWIGIDGFLILLYGTIVGSIFYALKTSNNFIIGKLIPAVIMITVTVIFFTYIGSILSFMRHSRKGTDS
ncbi:MAG: hypothetical protein CSA35_05600 [Dethiosulfovibrio peptidovorans]|nr:MAG: hypothetical protein CSA35_05600 [Dethiosulfovibrio peptidovorans]